MSNNKILANYIIAVVILLGMVVLAAVFGPAHITVGDFFSVILSKLPGGEWVNVDPSHVKIIFGLRLPRILLALFVGMGLAVAGTVFQSVFANPMAEPYLLGVSSGAALGATIAAVLNISFHFLAFSAMSIFAFIGALLVVFVVYQMAMGRDHMPMTVLLLSGLAMNYLLTAIMTLLMTFHQDHIESVYFWTLGSFKNASPTKVIIVALVVILSMIYLVTKHKEMDLLILGDEQASSLGVEVKHLKKMLLVVASIVSAAIVSAAGIIGFVGLIIPHTVRLISGPKHRRLLPLAGIAGSIFMIMSDTIARSLLPNKEISIGIITSMCGVPFFLWLLYKNRRGLR